jgi:hypothetical protein
MEADQGTRPGGVFDFLAFDPDFVLGGERDGFRFRCRVWSWNLFGCGPG